MEQKKYIGNVGILDIRETTKEIVEKIAGVGNVGLLIYTREVKPLLTELKCDNVGAMYEVEAHTQLVSGIVDIDKKALNDADPPLSYLINGQLSFTHDVTPADIEKGLGKIWVNGLVVCPKDCIPTIRSRLEMINGKILPFEARQTIVYEKLIVTGAMLEQMTTPEKYLVLGKMVMLDDFDPKLLASIKSIEVFGMLVLRQKYYNALCERFNVHEEVDIRPELPNGLQGRINITGGKLEIIPDNVNLLDDDIEFDAVALKRCDKSRFWTDNRVRFAHDVTPDLLAAHIISLKCDDIIICRKELRPALLDLCENDADILAYENDIIIVDGSQTLSSAELKFRTGTFALFVTGKLTIEPDVDPQTLYDRIEFIVNNGKIVCHGDMCGALRARLRDNKGKIVDACAPKEEKKDEKEYLVKNTGFFKL